MGCGSSTPPKHALELYSKPPNAPVEVTTVCVIANPYSGGKRGGAVLKEVQRLLEVRIVAAPPPCAFFRVLVPIFEIFTMAVKG